MGDTKPFCDLCEMLPNGRHVFGCPADDSPRHVCGASGFGLGPDDVCQACQAHSAEMAIKRETPAQAFERGRQLGMEQARREQWLPIEHAPKDGTPLMGCTWIESLPHLYSPRRIFWAAYHPNATGKERWRDAETCGNKLERLTHYRPLLAAPAASSTTAGERG